jgi:hypothetical protein
MNTDFGRGSSFYLLFAFLALIYLAVGFTTRVFYPTRT